MALPINIDEQEGVPVLPPAGIGLHAIDGIQKELVNLCALVQPTVNGKGGKKDRHLSEAAAEGVERIRKEAVEPSAGMLADLVPCGFPDVDGHNLAKTGAAVHEHEVLEPVKVFPDQTDSLVEIVLYHLVRDIMSAQHRPLEHAVGGFLQGANAKIKQRDFVTGRQELLHHRKYKTAGEVGLKSEILPRQDGGVFPSLEFTGHTAFYPPLLPVGVFPS